VIANSDHGVVTALKRSCSQSLQRLTLRRRKLLHGIDHTNDVSLAA